MNSARICSALVTLVVLVSSSVSQAVVPGVIGFQGRLVMSDGSIPPDDSYSITFSMWDDPAGGSMLWSETQQVDVLDGQFHVELGSEDDIPMEQLSFNYERVYFQTQVVGDSPMMPRIPLSSVPYSLVSSRMQGDVLTGPGSLSVGVEQPSFKWAELSGAATEARLTLGEQDQEQLSLTAGDDGSHVLMVDSFFDAAYHIELEATPGGTELTLGNIGSTGEDGVSIDVVDTGSMLSLKRPDAAGNPAAQATIGVDDNGATCGIEHEDIGGSVAAVSSSAGGAGGTLVVSNIGSSGQDGVTIGADDNSATCGIEHEDIGGSASFANSSADATGSIHEVGHNLSADHTFAANVRADDSGAGLLAVDSFFDAEYRIDSHATDTEAASRISADNGLNVFSREDIATPNLYQSTCDGSHEFGHSFIIHAIDDQGSSGEYRWQPEVGDEVLVGFHAGSSGGTLTVSNIGSSGEDGVSINVNDTAKSLGLKKNDASGNPAAQAMIAVDDNAATCGIEHEDIGAGGGYSVGSTASATGATLKVSNIGDSGEDGIAMISDDAASSISIREGGVNDRVRMSSDGITDQLSLGDIDHNGRLDLVAGSSSSDLSVFFSDPFGKSGVRLGSVGGEGGGAQIALEIQPAGETVPIQIVALHLDPIEPLMVVRDPYTLPPPPDPVYICDFEEGGDFYCRFGSSNSSATYSSRASANGFHVFDGSSELSLDTRGLFFGDPTGPTCAITPLGDVTLKRGVIMAQDPGTGVGIGGPSAGFKLYVDGDICATGSIGPCSDARYKKNIESIEDAIGIVSRLRGVRFDWRTEEFTDKHFSDKRQIGMIAQEVDKVVPEVVTKGADGYYSLDYARLTPVLIEAINQQQKTIESLQAELEENRNLRAELNELKNIVQKLASNRHEEQSGAVAETVSN